MVQARGIWGVSREKRIGVLGLSRRREHRLRLSVLVSCLFSRRPLEQPPSAKRPVRNGEVLHARVPDRLHPPRLLALLAGGRRVRRDRGLLAERRVSHSGPRVLWAPGTEQSWVGLIALQISRAAIYGAPLRSVTVIPPSTGPV